MLLVGVFSQIHALVLLWLADQVQRSLNWDQLHSNREFRSVSMEQVGRGW